MTPKAAAEDAITRIVRKHPQFEGALVVINKNGEWGAACHGWIFKYSVRNPTMNQVQVFTVNPIEI
jgi:N4-(beta-N-acetylglucosaminyl)-L-asparaginase